MDEVFLTSFFQGTGSVDGGAVAAGAPGRESAEGPPPLYNTNHDFKFSYSEIDLVEREKLMIYGKYF